jgi:anhydro-N-acetylmuramic acid kinase
MASRPGPHRYLGTISGTSVDGLDLAIIEVVDIGKEIRFVASTTQTFPDSLRERLLALGQPENDDLDLLGAADRALGEFIAEAAVSFIRSANLTATDIRAIGSHGQTVRHRPDFEYPFTWQIGDPNVIAERTGITTVADFRRRDMAANGQGAPLVPRFHEALFRSDKESLAILNVGGISNLSLLPADDAQPIRGFDCGPGNALLDSWCQLHRQQPYDRNGLWASSGRVCEPLLRVLMEDPYLQRQPPKSTGREYYNLNWLQRQLETLAANPDPADVQRTLLEFTALGITQALENWGSECLRMVVCGGGRLNDALIDRLAALSRAEVETSEQAGYDGDAIEAAAFGWLAHQRLEMKTGSASSVTGASADRILGAVYPGG